MAPFIGAISLGGIKMKLFNIKWDVDTAGPSPNSNKRIELFLKGCNKAMEGNPCPGCFNEELWDPTAEIEYDSAEIVETILSKTNSKYITIGGGEPTDQIEELIQLCKELKRKDFHVIVYTHHNLERKVFVEKDQNFKRLMKYSDMIISEPYIANLHQHRPTLGDGFYSSIGSSNQRVWDTSEYPAKQLLEDIQYFEAKDIDALAITQTRRAIYFLKPKFFKGTKEVGAHV